MAPAAALKQKRLLWLGFAILLSILFLAFRRLPIREGFQVTSGRIGLIPAIIWTYWNGSNIPPVVKKCIESWKKQNPMLEVRVITPRSLSQFLPNLDLKAIQWNDSPAREADIVRINLLAEYGGFWCDASILMTRPLSFDIGPGTECIFYYLEGWTTNPKSPVVENWFFGTVAGGKFIRAWRDRFMAAGNCESIEACIKQTVSEGVDLQNITDSLKHYLYMHVCAQYVLQKVMTENEIKSTMAFFKAEDGPYKYLVDAKWDPGAAAKSICKDTSKGIYKMRSHERKIIESSKELTDCFLVI
jgi:hypothetical protein